MEKKLRPLTWMEIYNMQRASGKTVVEFSEMFGVSRATYQNWIRNPHDPKHREPKPVQMQMLLDYQAKYKK